MYSKLNRRLKLLILVGAVLVVGGVCSMATLHKHQSEYYEVIFKEDSTLVDAQLPAASGRIVSEAELQTFVSSFKPANPAGIPQLVDAV